ALLYVFKSYYPSTVSAMNIAQFATLISAVDPVAVISVFEEMHVNRVLYICVFGESLLNDAVSVVLYHTTNIMSEVGLDNLRSVDYFTALTSFFTVSLGGILIGFIGALLTALLTKYSQKSSTSAIVGCFIFPYMAYIVAEALGLSGMLASEAVIFIFLGISAVSRNHEVCFVFVLVAIVACLICRFAGVYLLTYLINRGRAVKISLVDQFIMAYGGIRGAVCYGLVMSLDTDVVPCRNMLTTTVIVVVLFTVFVQGGTIKYFVRWLHVAIAEERHKNMADMVIGK
ncbi:sodium/hydrogen exchanger, partial [Aphelenchoides avenae]